MCIRDAIFAYLAGNFTGQKPRNFDLSLRKPVRIERYWRPKRLPLTIGMTGAFERFGGRVAKRLALPAVEQAAPNRGKAERLECQGREADE
jgi:hypothetical protein